MVYIPISPRSTMEDSKQHALRRYSWDLLSMRLYDATGSSSSRLVRRVWTHHAFAAHVALGRYTQAASQTRASTDKDRLPSTTQPLQNIHLPALRRKSMKGRSRSFRVAPARPSSMSPLYVVVPTLSPSANIPQVSTSITGSTKRRFAMRGGYGLC